MTSNVVGRHPNGSCASRRTTVSRAAPCSPQRWHQSSGSTTRQASTARSGSSSCPVTSKPKLVEAAELAQVRGREGSVRHVEVFRVGSVRTPIIGRPRPLPGHRRARRPYTLVWDEPLELPADLANESIVSIDRVDFCICTPSSWEPDLCDVKDCQLCLQLRRDLRLPDSDAEGCDPLRCPGPWQRLEAPPVSSLTVLG